MGKALHFPVGPFVIKYGHSLQAQRDLLVVMAVWHTALEKRPYSEEMLNPPFSCRSLPLLGPQTLRKGWEPGLGVPMSSPHIEKLPGHFIHASVFKCVKWPWQK